MIRPKIDLGSGKLQKAFEALLAWTDYNKPINGRGVKTSQASNGIAINASVSAASIAAALPWAPTLTNVGSAESPEWVATINPASYLYSNIASRTRLEVSNLLTDDEPTEFAVVDGTVIYLQGEHNASGVGIDFTIETAVAPDNTPAWEMVFNETDGVPWLEFWRLPLCLIDVTDDVATVAEIFAFNHLRLHDRVLAAQSGPFPLAV